MKNPRPRRHPQRVTLPTIAGLVALSASVACAPPGRVIDPGQRIHHDDFEYIVDRVDRTPRIGAHEATGTYLVVTFTVENRARAIDHVWGNDIAYVIDAKGRQYENDASLQQELARAKPSTYAERHVTPAGATESTTLVFDVPADVPEPYLKVRGEFLMGDLFDGDQYQRVKVKLF